MQRTFTWTYQVTIAGPTATSSAEDTTRIDSVSGSSEKTATYTTTRKAGSTILSQASGTMTQTSSSLTIASDGGSEVISLPLTAGKDWTSGSLSARSFAVESLTVGGKTYKDVVAIAYSKDGDTRAVRWLAPDVGIIKQVARITSGSEVTTVTSELKSAQVSAVTAVSLSPLSLSLGIGATGSVYAQVTYDGGSIGRELTLSISDPAIASLNASGLVTGLASGSTVITARSTQDSGKFATMSVTVN